MPRAAEDAEKPDGRRNGRRRARSHVVRIARRALGFDELRPGQTAAMQSVLEGRDTLAVMPTGSGKSAIYEVGGLQLEGPTIVVSPLIALQRDQVEGLRERGVAAAAVVNSTLGRGERREALDDVQDGEVEFLFLAPEQFGNEEMLDELRAARPSLFVVDEAHCISEWGHDFRPDYLKLGAVVEALGRPTVLALTATAAPRVREEIVQRLGMRNPRVVVRGFDRPNLRLAVERFEKETAKTAALLRRVAGADKPGIVYVATRRQAEDVASVLVESGLRADAYHAGMRPADREAAQSRFMDGGSEVIVATSAFGMGIDKPDVRFVFHQHVSESLDAYYQEVGRGGRDGDPAEAILFYRPENLGLRRFFASGGRVDEEQIAQVAEAIRELAGPVHPRELAEQMDFSGAKLASALTSLEQVGLVERLANGHVRSAARELETDDAMEEAARIHRRRRNLDLTRIEVMKGYAEAPGCRRKFVLDYFGEGFDPPCGRCDNCEAGAEVQPEDAERPFPLQSRVAHPDWGEGVVLRYEEDRVTVLFEEEGYKTLAVPVVLERRLLERAG